MDITDIMSSEFHWAKLVIGVTIGVFVAYYFRKKKKENDVNLPKHDIEIIPPPEDDTLGVIDRYEKLHSYTTENTDAIYTTNTESSTNLDILEQQLLENIEGNNLMRQDQQLLQRKGNHVTRTDNHDPKNQSGLDTNLAGAIREQVHRCHTAIAHLQNRLQNESGKRQQAEEWCGMLEKELTAHLAARQTAETKCEKLHRKIKLLSGKLKSRERLLRKRQKETLQNNYGDNQNNQNGICSQQHQVHNGRNRIEQCVPEIQITSAEPSGGGEEFVDDEEDEDYYDDSTNIYTSFPDDDEPHFASDLDEDKIVEPQELQKIIEAADEVSDDEDDEHDGDSEDESDLESDQEEPRTDDLNDLLYGLDVSDDNLSDILAANVEEKMGDEGTDGVDDKSIVDASTDDHEADISAESIGNTQTTRDFWEKKATEQDEPSMETKDPVIHNQLEMIKKSALVRRGGSFRDPSNVTKVPILKPSGKEYSQEAECVQTQSMMADRLPNSESIKKGDKLSIETMREHWEKNQRKWGSSQVINAKHDGSNGSREDSDVLAELERSSDFRDLKDAWNKKHEKERLGRPEISTDINENTKIERDDNAPGFQALKDEWESKTQEQDESL